jgi:hypothetical protein
LGSGITSGILAVANYVENHSSSSFKSSQVSNIQTTQLSENNVIKTNRIGSSLLKKAVNSIQKSNGDATRSDSRMRK